jgi:hypothetical protein
MNATHATHAKRIEFYAEIRRETEMAYCFYDGREEFWLPKSLCTIVERLRGGNVEAAVPEWLAKSKGIV